MINIPPPKTTKINFCDDKPNTTHKIDSTQDDNNDAILYKLYFNSYNFYSIWNVTNKTVYILSFMKAIAI